MFVKTRFIFQLHFLTKNYSQKAQSDQQPASDIYRFLKTDSIIQHLENSRCQTYVLVDENYGDVVTAGERLESFFYVGDARVYTRLNITSHRLRNDLQCILRREGHKPLLTHSLTSRKHNRGLLCMLRAKQLNWVNVSNITV